MEEKPGQIADLLIAFLAKLPSQWQKRLWQPLARLAHRPYCLWRPELTEVAVAGWQACLMGHDPTGLWWGKLCASVLQLFDFRASSGGTYHMRA